MESRTLLVSNRLPITASVIDGNLRVERSVGGLATALSGAKCAGTLWVGWPGPTSELGRRQGARLDRRLAALQCVPVRLSSSEVRGYYEEIANGMLWPLFHYQPDRLPLDPKHWGTYATVNARFAETVASSWRPGDEIWMHDYQLLPVPGMLRRLLPDARIGFFLPVPFPALDVFRVLPWRREILEGILGADVVGLHTDSYVAHFRSAVAALTDASVSGEQLTVDGRPVLTRAYPIGIDVGHFAERAARPAVVAEAETLRAVGAQRLIVGIDRLDYTKGIPRRLLAYDRLLSEHPELHGNVRFIQVVVPSREGVRTYREVRNVVDATIGHINGAYGTGTWTPVAYQYRSLTDEAISALYLAADVMLVTPVRDGMNLVAKEFIASREDLGGVLVLSEFAGAAEQLSEALIVNPYDLDGTASALYRALVMPRDEIETRMRSLRDRVHTMPSDRWAQTFLADLRAVRPPERTANGGSFATADELGHLGESAKRAPSLHLLLDYDGTLVAFTDVPSSASPDAELIDLLDRLSKRPATDVHLVSGRSREQLDEWFGELPIALHAEHGLWSREAGDRRWTRQEIDSAPPFEDVLALMRRCAEATPGALVERKSAGLAWHYRMAEPSLGEASAHQLLRELEAAARESPMDLLHGDKVVEVRPRGIHKGIVAARGAATRRKGGGLLAMGDDRTDEDLLEPLPDGSLSVHVGPSASQVSTRIESVSEARDILRALLNGR